MIRLPFKDIFKYFITKYVTLALFYRKNPNCKKKKKKKKKINNFCFNLLEGCGIRYTYTLFD